MCLNKNVNELNCIVFTWMRVCECVSVDKSYFQKHFSLARWRRNIESKVLVRIKTESLIFRLQDGIGGNCFYKNIRLGTFFPFPHQSQPKREETVALVKSKYEFPHVWVDFDAKKEKKLQPT